VVGAAEGMNVFHVRSGSCVCNRCVSCAVRCDLPTVLLCYVWVCLWGGVFGNASLHNLGPRLRLLQNLWAQAAVRAAHSAS
jgi:hypothetical protein